MLYKIKAKSKYLAIQLFKGSQPNQTSSDPILKFCQYNHRIRSSVLFWVFALLFARIHWCFLVLKNWAYLALSLWLGLLPGATSWYQIITLKNGLVLLAGPLKALPLYSPCTLLKHFEWVQHLAASVWIVWFLQYAEFFAIFFDQHETQKWWSTKPNHITIHPFLAKKCNENQPNQPSVCKH